MKTPKGLLDREGRAGKIVTSLVVGDTELQEYQYHSHPSPSTTHSTVTSTCYALAAPGDIIQIEMLANKGTADIVDVIIDGILRYSLPILQTTKKFKKVQIKEVFHTGKSASGKKLEATKLWDMIVKERNKSRDVKISGTDNISPVGSIIIKCWRKSTTDTAAKSDEKNEVPKNKNTHTTKHDGEKENGTIIVATQSIDGMTDTSELIPAPPTYDNHKEWHNFNTNVSSESLPLPPFEIEFINPRPFHKSSLIRATSKGLVDEVALRKSSEYTLFAEFVFHLRSTDDLTFLGFKNVPVRSAPGPSDPKLKKKSNSEAKDQKEVKIPENDEHAYSDLFDNVDDGQKQSRGTSPEKHQKLEEFTLTKGTKNKAEVRKLFIEGLKGAPAHKAWQERGSTQDTESTSASPLIDHVEMRVDGLVTSRSPDVPILASDDSVEDILPKAKGLVHHRSLSAAATLKRGSLVPQDHHRLSTLGRGRAGSLPVVKDSQRNFANSLLNNESASLAGEEVDVSATHKSFINKSQPHIKLEYSFADSDATGLVSEADIMESVKRSQPLVWETLQPTHSLSFEDEPLDSVYHTRPSPILGKTSACNSEAGIECPSGLGIIGADLLGQSNITGETMTHTQVPVSTSIGDELKTPTFSSPGSIRYSPNILKALHDESFGMLHGKMPSDGNAVEWLESFSSGMNETFRSPGQDKNLETTTATFHAAEDHQSSKNQTRLPPQIAANKNITKRKGALMSGGLDNGASAAKRRTIEVTTPKSKNASSSQPKAYHVKSSPQRSTRTNSGETPDRPINPDGRTPGSMTPNQLAAKRKATQDRIAAAVRRKEVLRKELEEAEKLKEQFREVREMEEAAARAEAENDELQAQIEAIYGGNTT